MAGQEIKVRYLNWVEEFYKHSPKAVRGFFRCHKTSCARLRRDQTEKRVG